AAARYRARQQGTLPTRYERWLTQSWADDDARRTKAGVPEDIEFKTKPEIALEQIRWACEAGLPRGVVIIDAGYGVEAKFRSEISALKLKYVAGVKTTNTVWAPDTFASPLAANWRRGRNESTLISVEKLALALPKN